jgi:SAM-dependent MidA family methyltransferase
MLIPPARPLVEILASRIRANGAITFAEYMDACLYHPEFGYYTKPAQQARRDYFTNADVSPLFGRFLARQIHEMWTTLARPGRFQIVEAGAGTGALAKHLLDFTAAQFPDFYQSLCYQAIERSEPRKSAAVATSMRHIKAGRFESHGDLPAEIPCGCILSNEFFDALPVHRVVGHANSLQELYVNYGENGFYEQPGPISTPALALYFERHGITLQSDQQAEVNLKACTWIREGGKRLAKGYVLTIDYGYEAAELFSARHMRGTLLAYERHRASEKYFRAPGEQDLTSHVDFTAIDRAGQRGGLVRAGFTSQSNFLLAIARKSNFADLEAEGTSEQEQARARNIFKTLIHPEGMGETFKVLVQHKGIEPAPLTGLAAL